MKRTPLPRNLRPQIREVLAGRRRWALAHGDCLDVLRLIPDGRIDAVVTDPPYGIALKPNARAKVARFAPLANDKQPFIWWLYDACRVLKPGGVLLCFCAPRTQEDFRRSAELAGFKIRSQVIWDRGAHGPGDLTGAFAIQHDVIWFATKGRYKFPGGRPKTILRAPRVPWSRAIHPTEKPVELLAQLIRATVRPGGVVLDPCAGSGSTLAAALSVGCRAVGVELDRGHLEAGLTRIGRVL